MFDAAVLAVVEDAGSAAIITAIGGVIVSLCSIWFNSKKSGSNTDSIVSLAEEIAELRAENAVLKAEVAALRLELKRYKDL